MSSGPEAMSYTPTREARQSSLLRQWDATGVPSLLARLIVGGLFIYMGFNKTQDPVGFLKLIREYQMIPQGMPVLLNVLAVTLPWLEVLCGVLLIAGVAVRGTAGLLVTMLVGFTAIIAVRAVDIYQSTGQAFCQIAFDCGCGTGVVNICFKLFVENTGLLLLSLVALWSRSRKFCLRWSLVPGRRAG